MAPHIAVADVAAQREKMSLQVKLLMKMALSQLSRFVKYVNAQLGQSVQSEQNVQSAELVTVANAIVLEIVTAEILVEITVSHTVAAEQ
jgi:hypothetical protein